MNKPLLFGMGLIELTGLVLGILSLFKGYVPLSGAIALTAIGGVIFVLDMAKTTHEAIRISRHRLILQNVKVVPE